MRWALAAAIGVLAAAPAWASDKDPCPAGLICASNPSGVADALRMAGYKAVLTKDDGGDPMIESASSGYEFDVLFYDCDKNIHCASLQFRLVLALDGKDGNAIAKAWNEDRRFATAYVSKKGNLIVNTDVTTIGGINQKNFADIMAWVDTKIGEARDRVANAPSPTKS